jgi:hypothetical protein
MPPEDAHSTPVMVAVPVITLRATKGKLLQLVEAVKSAAVLLQLDSAYASSVALHPNVVPQAQSPHLAGAVEGSE